MILLPAEVLASRSLISRKDVGSTIIASVTARFLRKVLLSISQGNSIHLSRLLGGEQMDQADTDWAQLLVDKVLDFKTATDSTTNEALQWLRVSWEEYTAAQDLEYFQ